MIKLNAAARLKVVAGELNKAEARKFLKTLGLSLGRQEKIDGQTNNAITFLLSDEPAEAAKSVSQRLKVKPDVSKGSGRKEWTFDTSGYRRIRIWEDRYGGHVSLIDLN